jgi:hypothetical protein
VGQFFQPIQLTLVNLGYTKVNQGIWAESLGEIGLFPCLDGGGVAWVWFVA